MTFVRKLLAVAALAATGSAFAADTPGAYLLAAGGTSKYDDSCAGTTTCDTTGNSFKFVGGYRLGNSIAVEGVVLDFGKAKVTIGSLSGELKTTAYGGGVALYADTGPWLFNARLGIASVKAKATARQGTNSGSTSETTTSAYAGLGVGYRFTDAVSLELGYDTTRAKIAGEDENVSAFTIGIGVKF